MSEPAAKWPPLPVPEIRIEVEATTAHGVNVVANLIRMMESRGGFVELIYAHNDSEQPEPENAREFMNRYRRKHKTQRASLKGLTARVVVHDPDLTR